MQEIGIVESVNESRGTAKVVFDRKSACDKCGMCLTSKGEKMKVYVEVKNTLGAKVGDRVGVTMSDRFVLRAAFIVYLIPVILIGAGLAIFRKFSEMVLLAVIAAGLVLGVVVGIFADRLIRKKSTFAPSLSGIYPPEEDSGEMGDAPSADDTESDDALSEETAISDDDTAPTDEESSTSDEGSTEDK